MRCNCRVDGACRRAPSSEGGAIENLGKQFLPCLDHENPYRPL